MNVELTRDLQVLVICTGVLYLKFLLTTMIQGRMAFAADTRMPEDKALPMAKKKHTATSFSAHSSPMPVAEELAEQATTNGAAESEARWKRIIQNDLESIPLAIAVFLVANLAVGNRNLNALLTVIYTAARVLHTVAYAAKRPVLRMFTWVVGVVTIVATATLSIVSVV